jgi:hypothetical protein
VTSRSRGYVLRTGVVRATVIPVTTTAMTPTTQRLGAPDTAITPRNSAPRTSAGPRSGCDMTKPTGVPATSQASATSRWVGDDRRGDPEDYLGELAGLPGEPSGQLDPPV